MSITGIPELKESYRKLGALRFSLILLGTCAWIAIGAWLAISLNWPDSYGFHCHGRGCLIEDIWNSRALIKQGHGSAMEWGMFLWLWSIPAAAVAALLYSFVKKRPNLSIFEPTSSE